MMCVHVVLISRMRFVNQDLLPRTHAQRSKVISFVCHVSVVVTKIAKSRHLGTSKCNQSVEICEKLA